MKITSFTLLNADTGQVVLDFDPLVDGTTINLDEVGYNLSIRANVDSCFDGVGSVKFHVGSGMSFLGTIFESIDNTFPYYLLGDSGKPDCRLTPWRPVTGDYQITATPYSGANATGTPGMPLTITITVETAGATPTGSTGWTSFTTSGDTVQIYVSSGSGSDSNAGTIGSPYATLAKAVSVLRDGMPDWIYLKRGDVWHESFVGWHLSGKSEAEPKLITYYGSGNPPRVDGELDISTLRNVDHLAIVGVEFWSNKRDPDDGSFDAAYAKKFTTLIRANAPMDGLLIEGCRFGFGDIEIINDVKNFRFRRNTHKGNYVQNPSATGDGLKAYDMYVSNRGNPFTVEENIFDYGGWNATVSGAARPILGHCCYFDSGSGPGLVRWNIACRGSDQGLMLRCGGVLDNNLVIDCCVGMLVGSTPSKITSNVCLGGADFSSSPADSRGYGPESHAPPVVLITDNIIANKNDGVGMGDALTLQYRDTRGWHAGDPPITLPVNPQIEVGGNVFYNWHGTFRIKVYDGSLNIHDNRFVDSGSAAVVNMDYTSASLLFRSNKWHSAASANQQMKLNGMLMSFGAWALATGDTSQFVAQSFVDNTVTLESYHVSIGGTGVLNDFMATALAMWRGSWDTNYTAPTVNDYMRAGFTDA